MLKAIHHVAIICTDYEKSKHFYTNILGLQMIAENYRAERQSYKLDLQLPSGGQIELFSFPKPPMRPTNPEAAGLRHVAFSVDDIEQVCAYFVSHQVMVEAIRIDEFTGKKFTFISDPDGLPIELYEQ